MPEPAVRVLCGNCANWRPGYVPYADPEGKDFTSWPRGYVPYDDPKGEHLGTCRWWPNEPIGREERRPKCVLFQRVGVTGSTGA